jgi:vacuolar-type H+-ATPase subunit I/STV1
MGKKCHTFIDHEYPLDDELKIRALGISRRGTVLSEMSTMEDQEVAANDVILAIAKVQTKTCVMTKPILLEKHDAYYTLGRIAVRRQDPEVAIQHFNKCKNILHSAGHSIDDIDVMKLEMQIAEASALLPNADKLSSNRTIMKLQRTIFQETKRKFGKTSHYTMAEGWNLAVSLFDLKEFADAKYILLDLTEVARQVHGPDHPRTKGINRFLQKIQRYEEMNRHQAD